jgi:hypothetical protein
MAVAQSRQEIPVNLCPNGQEYDQHYLPLTNFQVDPLWSMWSSPNRVKYTSKIFQQQAQHHQAQPQSHYGRA